MKLKRAVSVALFPPVPFLFDDNLECIVNQPVYFC